MLDYQVSLREKKRVALKFQILDAFIEALATKQIHEINIADLCKQIKTTKVTFFNYFRSKEEVVEYFIQLWQYDMGYQIEKGQLVGRAALFYLFDQVGGHPSGRTIMLALMAYFLKTEDYCPSRVSDYELYCYNQDAYIQGYRQVTIYEMVKRAVQEMQVEPRKQQQMTTNIISGFYGVPFLSKLNYGIQLQAMYRDYLEAILPKEPL